MSTTRVRALLRAPRTAVYQALTDPALIGRWRFPDGMTSVVEPQDDGGFRVTLTYVAPDAHPVAFHAVDADAERTLFAGTRPFPVAALTGTAGDLLLAVWRRVPLEVLTVDGDGLQAAAMIGLVELE